MLTVVDMGPSFAVDDTMYDDSANAIVGGEALHGRAAGMVPVVNGFRAGFGKLRGGMSRSTAPDSKPYAFRMGDLFFRGGQFQIHERVVCGIPVNVVHRHAFGNRTPKRLPDDAVREVPRVGGPGERKLEVALAIHQRRHRSADGIKQQTLDVAMIADHIEAFVACDGSPCFGCHSRNVAQPEDTR